MVGDPSARVVDALERLAQVQRVLVQQVATGQGLSPIQVRILLLLGAGSTRPSALADRLGVTRPTVTDALRALRAKGLVGQATAADARGRVVHLTVAGAAAAGRLQAWAAPFGDVVATLPEAEQGRLLAVLLRLIASMQARGLVPPSRMCLTCRFFRPPSGPGRENRCDLLGADLPDPSLRLDCSEHEPACA